MAPPNRLSYLSSKCVLEHISADRRISEFSHALPKFNHMAPLRINNLTIGRAGFSVDDLLYKFEVKLNRDRKESVVFDLDWDGQKETEDHLAEGDVKIYDRRHNQEVRIKQEEEAEHNDLIASRNLRFYTQHGDLGYQSFVHAEGGRIGSEMSKKEFPDGSKLRDEYRNMIRKVLFNRAYPPLIRKLVIKPTYGVLRFPEGFRMRVKEIVLSENGAGVLGALEPIIMKESFPLKSLTILAQSAEDSIFDLEIVQEAECLRIECYNFPSGFDNWNLLIPKLNCKEIYMKGMTLFLNTFKALINKWRRDNSPIGTKFSVEEGALSIVEYFVILEIGLIAKPIQGKGIFDCLKLPLNTTSEITIYAYDVEPGDPGRARRTKWALALEVTKKLIRNRRWETVTPAYLL